MNYLFNLLVCKTTEKKTNLLWKRNKPAASNDGSFFRLANFFCFLPSVKSVDGRILPWSQPPSPPPSSCTTIPLIRQSSYLSSISLFLATSLFFLFFLLNIYPSLYLYDFLYLFLSSCKVFFIPKNLSRSLPAEKEQIIAIHFCEYFVLGMCKITQFVEFHKQCILQAHLELRGNQPFKSNSLTVVDFTTVS